jgi:transposase InsO family protein
MAERARAFVAYSHSIGQPAGLVFRDHDKKFRAKEFDGELEASGVMVHTLACRAPNTNAYIERFIQTFQQECLNVFVVCGSEHMDLLVREYVEHYHTERPHQSKGNAPLVETTATGPPEGEVLCRERLGGVLRHYYRAAA